MRISFKAKIADKSKDAENGCIYYVPETHMLHFYAREGCNWVVDLEHFDVTIHHDGGFAHPSFAARLDESAVAASSSADQVLHRAMESAKVSEALATRLTSSELSAEELRSRVLTLEMATADLASRLRNLQNDLGGSAGTIPQEAILRANADVGVQHDSGVVSTLHSLGGQEITSSSEHVLPISAVAKLLADFQQEIWKCE